MAARERSFSFKPTEEGVQLTTVTTVVEDSTSYDQAISKRDRERNIAAVIAIAEGFVGFNAIVYTGVKALEVANEFFLRGDGIDLQKVAVGAVIGATGLLLGSKASENYRRAGEAWEDAFKLRDAQRLEQYRIRNANRIAG